MKYLGEVMHSIKASKQLDGDPAGDIPLIGIATYGMMRVRSWLFGYGGGDEGVRLGGLGVVAVVRPVVGRG